MKDLIKKILKESEEDDLGWAKEIKPMEGLRYTEIHGYKVDYYQLEQFIKRVYDKEINIPSMLESSNDTTHEFSTDSSWYEPEEISMEIEEWLEEDGWISLRSIIYDLAVNKKLIPSGKWFVRVSW